MKRGTEILRFIGEVPVIEASWYDDHTWFFYCRHCKAFHYHRPHHGRYAAKCKNLESEFRKTGYILDVN